MPEWAFIDVTVSPPCQRLSFFPRGDDKPANLRTLLDRRRVHGIQSYHSKSAVRHCPFPPKTPLNPVINTQMPPKSTRARVGPSRRLRHQPRRRRPYQDYLRHNSHPRTHTAALRKFPRLSAASSERSRSWLPPSRLCFGARASVAAGQRASRLPRCSPPSRYRRKLRRRRTPWPRLFEAILSCFCVFF